jgi:hypothetical protein
MKTPQWIKQLGSQAARFYLAAELAKRGIVATPRPSHRPSMVDIQRHDGSLKASVHITSCHPDRASSFFLLDSNEAFVSAGDDEFFACVLLSSPPRYWLATKREVGQTCVDHPAHGSTNHERRFQIERPANPRPQDAWIDPTWEDRWELFDLFLPETKP